MIVFLCTWRDFTWIYSSFFSLGPFFFLPTSRQIHHQKFVHVGVEPFLSLHGGQQLTLLSEGSVVGHHHVPLHRGATLTCPLRWRRLRRATPIPIRTRSEESHKHSPLKAKPYLVCVLWGANIHPCGGRPLLLPAADWRVEAAIVGIFQSRRQSDGEKTPQPPRLASGLLGDTRRRETCSEATKASGSFTGSFMQTTGGTSEWDGTCETAEGEPAPLKPCPGCKETAVMRDGMWTVCTFC